MNTRNRRQFHPLSVQQVEQETDDAVSVYLEIPAQLSEEYHYDPGQYLTLRTTINGEDIRRSYSICSIPSDPFVRVGIRKVPNGAFSSFANDHLKAGDTLQVMTPDGRFTVQSEKASSHRYLVFAAGSGITPVLSIIRAVLEHEPRSHVTLIYGNRQIASIMFLDELGDLKNRFMQRFKLLHLLSRQKQDIKFLNGRITEQKIDQLIGNNFVSLGGLDQVFVCGPDEMINCVTQSLTSHGVDKSIIKSEHFTPSHDTANYTPPQETVQAVADGVTVDVILDGVRQSFVVANDQHKVLQAAQHAGLDLPFSCAGGMCATCRCRVLEGSVHMDVNYSLEDWELEKQFVLACQSRPTSKHIVLDFDAT